MRGDVHCQNFFSGKDITPKITQPFFKSSYELHVAIYEAFGVRLLFNQEAIEIRVNAHR